MSDPPGRSRPEAICFDAYDTLITLADPATHVAQRFAEHGVPIPVDLARKAFAAEAAYYRRHSLHGGTADSLAELRRACARVMGDLVATRVPHSLNDATLVGILLDSLEFELRPGVPKCLRTARAMGLKMAVVSNWDCSLEDLLAELDLDGWFETVVASAVVGVEKPNPRTWDLALAALGSSPDRTWHIGDDPIDDAMGAWAAGLRPILVGPLETPPGVTRIDSLEELPQVLADSLDGGDDHRG